MGEICILKRTSYHIDKIQTLLQTTFNDSFPSIVLSLPLLCSQSFRWDQSTESAMPLYYRFTRQIELEKGQTECNKKLR